MAKAVSRSRLYDMWANSTLSFLSLCAAALVLSGCSSGNEPSGSGAPDTSSVTESEGQLGNQGRIVVSETAWLTVSEEGFVHTTFIDANGRYRDYREGELVFAGEWSESSQNKLCFSPDEGAGECWSFETPQADGTMRLLGDGGREIFIKRVTYSPLSETPDGDEAAAN